MSLSIAYFGVGGRIKQSNCYGSQYESFSKNIKIDLLYSPAKPFLSVCLKNSKLAHHKHICTTIFIAALLIKGKLQNQCMYQSTEERMMNIIYNIQFTYIWILSIYKWVITEIWTQLEIIILSKLNHLQENNYWKLLDQQDGLA